MTTESSSLDSVSMSAHTPTSTTNIISVSAYSQRHILRPREGTISESHQLCERIRTALPSYDTIISALKVNGKWFCHFYRKTNHSAVVYSDEFTTLAAQRYTGTDPIDLGFLTTAYARSTENEEHL